MPRTSTIAQADVARTLRAFRSLGVEAEVRIYQDGMVIVAPVVKDGQRAAPVRIDNGEDIRL